MSLSSSATSTRIVLSIDRLFWQSPLVTEVTASGLLPSVCSDGTSVLDVGSTGVLFRDNGDPARDDANTGFVVNGSVVCFTSSLSRSCAMRPTCDSQEMLPSVPVASTVAKYFFNRSTIESNSVQIVESNPSWLFLIAPRIFSPACVSFSICRKARNPAVPLMVWTLRNTLLMIEELSGSFSSSTMSPSICDKLSWDSIRKSRTASRIVSDAMSPEARASSVPEICIAFSAWYPSELSADESLVSLEESELRMSCSSALTFSETSCSFETWMASTNVFRRSVALSKVLMTSFVGRMVSLRSRSRTSSPR